MKKLVLLLSWMLGLQFWNSQMVIYDGYPLGQDFYSGGRRNFYKELRQAMLDNGFQPCDSRKEIYTIPVLVKADGAINFVKDDDSVMISKNKCAFDLIRKSLPYLEKWTPAYDKKNNEKVNAIVKIPFCPDDLFVNYKDTYTDPSDTEVMPSFPGGINEFRNQIMNIVNVDGINSDMRVTLMFEISETGEIINPKVDGVNPSSRFVKSAIVGLSKIKSKWSPATKNGMPVKYRFRLPLSITHETTYINSSEGLMNLANPNGLRNALYYNDAVKSGF